MKIEKATKIVTEFLKDMNPDMWNGNGNKPESFDEHGWQYSLTDDVNLEITFVNNEEDGWCHYPMRRKTPCFSYGDIRRVHRIYASN